MVDLPEPHIPAEHVEFRIAHDLLSTSPPKQHVQVESLAGFITSVQWYRDVTRMIPEW